MLSAKQVQAVSFVNSVQAIILVVQRNRFRNVAAACGQWHLKHRNNVATESSSATAIISIAVTIDMISVGTIVMAGLLWQESL